MTALRSMSVAPSGAEGNAYLLGDARIASVDSGKNPHAVALSRLGAAKGGAARARALTSTQRRDIARQAGLARGRALGARRRAEIARRAAAARWAGRLPDVLSPL